jgi:hypothetical protein
MELSLVQSSGVGQVTVVVKGATLPAPGTAKVYVSPTVRAVGNVAK